MILHTRKDDVFGVESILKRPRPVFRDNLRDSRVDLFGRSNTLGPQPDVASGQETKCSKGYTCESAASKQHDTHPNTHQDDTTERFADDDDCHVDAGVDRFPEPTVIFGDVSIPIHGRHEPDPKSLYGLVNGQKRGPDVEHGQHESGGEEDRGLERVASIGSSQHAPELLPSGPLCQSRALKDFVQRGGQVEDRAGDDNPSHRVAGRYVGDKKSSDGEGDPPVGEFLDRFPSRVSPWEPVDYAR